MVVTTRGFKELENEIKRFRQNVSDAQELLPHFAQIGRDKARELVPVDKGHTRDNIIHFQDGETWIIQSLPSPKDFGFPLNIYLEEGNLDALNWGKRTSPKSGQFGFFSSTYDWLVEVLPKQIKITLERN